MILLRRSLDVLAVARIITVLRLGLFVLSYGQSDFDRVISFRLFDLAIDDSLRLLFNFTYDVFATFTVVLVSQKSLMLLHQLASSYRLHCKKNEQN